MSTETYQSTTQVFLDIYDITNDLLIMKDGTVSVIITVDAMNFGLLAEEEQDAVMYAYAGLLNSLNYPIQIVIHSQTKDVTSYLQKLKEQEDIAPTRENQDRIKRYREFVSNLIRERNVLDKKFYVVIPATPIEIGLLPVSTVVPGSKQFDASSTEKSVLLEKARGILEPKRDHIIGQFGRIGLYSRQLTTQEIIQLFYLSYNPEAAEGQQLTETHNYTTPMVSAQVDTSVRHSAPQRPPAQPASVLPTQPSQPAVVVAPPAQQALAETLPMQNVLPQDPTQPVIEALPVVESPIGDPQPLPSLEPVPTVEQPTTISENVPEQTPVVLEQNTTDQSLPQEITTSDTISPELPPVTEPEVPISNYVPPDAPPTSPAQSFNASTITNPPTQPGTIFSGQTELTSATPPEPTAAAPKISNVLQKIRNTNLASSDQTAVVDSLPKPNNFTVFTQPSPDPSVTQPPEPAAPDQPPATSTPPPTPDIQETQEAINELADVAVQTPPLDQDTLPPLPEIK